MSRNSFPLKFDFTTVQNVTTGAACVLAANPVGLQTYAVQIAATGNTWVRFVGPKGATVASASQTVATPGVFTTATQAFTAGTPVIVTGNPTIPTGITAGAIYYVIATGLTTTACELATTPSGTGVGVTVSHPCIIQPLDTATATNSALIRLTDYAEQYGISPGQYIATLQVTATGTLNIVEMTH